MQTFLLVVSSIGIIVVVAAFVVLVAGVLREFRKIGQMSEDVSRFVKTAEEELSATTRDARTTLADIGKLVVGIGSTVGRVERISAEVERLTQTALAASAATRAIKSSSAGLIGVYEGVKQGIKALWGHDSDKEGTENE